MWCRYSRLDSSHSPPTHLDFNGVVGVGHIGGRQVENFVVGASGCVRRLGLGHRIEDSTPDGLKSEEVVGHFTACFGAWTAQEVVGLETLVGEPLVEGDVEPATAMLAELGQSVTAVQYLDALDQLQTWTRKLAAWWEDHDVLVLPTMPVLPTPLGAFDSPADNPLAGMAMSTAVVLYTAPFNISGQPAISLPVAVTDGLPIGAQLVGRWGRDDQLLALGAQLEERLGWQHRRPPTHVATI